MSLNLISDVNSPYYMSSAFDRILKYVQSNPRGCKLREIANKRSLLIRNVDSVETAVAILESI